MNFGVELNIKIKYITDYDMIQELGKFFGISPPPISVDAPLTTMSSTFLPWISCDLNHASPCPNVGMQAHVRCKISQPPNEGVILCKFPGLMEIPGFWMSRVPPAFESFCSMFLGLLKHKKKIFCSPPPPFFFLL